MHCFFSFFKWEKEGQEEREEEKEEKEEKEEEEGKEDEVGKEESRRREIRISDSSGKKATYQRKQNVNRKTRENSIPS